MHLIKYGFGVLLLCGLVFWYVKKPAAQEDHTILNVGTNAEYQPFSFLDNNDEIVGLDIDIAKEVCNRLGKKCVLHSLSFDALIPEIQLGTIHMIAAGMSPTPERAERVFFTKPHLVGQPLVMVYRADFPFTQQEKNNKEVALAHHRIAVNQGYVADSFVTQKECPHIVRLAGSSVSEGLLALKSNQADLYIVGEVAIKPFFEQDTEHLFAMEPIEGTQEKTALAVSKHYQELYKNVEEVLVAMQEDGTIAALIKKWNIS